MIEIQLEQLLTDRGMTAYALAKQAGLHQSVIAKFRHNAARAVRLDVLERLCAVLRCEVGELLVRVPDVGKAASVAMKTTRSGATTGKSSNHATEQKSNGKRKRDTKAA